MQLVSRTSALLKGGPHSPFSRRLVAQVSVGASFDYE
ncbi:hypothetical protein SZN_02577 [Streptomyces zinciresistens K42]|uniref:Uncharacterized protein n=1 Tax=Streptomyces zinciresistens K42 TaxID=700597 RepID=G2G4W2_9ACTN|nr:hypothetical protein SZN_02577 [Streptomyces zinciresistens K42]